MRVLLAGLLAALCGLLPPVYAVGQTVSLPIGSELLLTDMRGEVVLGYGRVITGQLELTLSERATDFVVLILFPEGGVEVRLGKVDVKGAVLLLDEAGVWQSLEALALAADLRLILRRVPEGTFTGRLKTDDDLLENDGVDRDRPRSGAPGQDEADADDNDERDDDDDDDEDDDGDDEDDDDDD